MSEPEEHFPPLVAFENAAPTFYEMLALLTNFVVTVFKHEGLSVQGQLVRIDDEEGVIYLMTQEGSAPALPQPGISLDDIKAITVQ